jgi:LPXTG-motif cell wall-anchored protein
VNSGFDRGRPDLGLGAGSAAVPDSRDQRTSEHFVDPSCRPGRFDPGSTLAVGLLAFAITAFQLTDESSWYAIGGALLLAASLILGWRKRAALSSVFRHPRDDDPRKLYGNRNA